MTLVWLTFIILLLVSGFYFVLAVYLLSRTIRLGFSADSGRPQRPLETLHSK